MPRGLASSAVKTAKTFAHYSAITSSGFKSLQEGQAVQFNVIKAAQGLAGS